MGIDLIRVMYVIILVYKCVVYLFVNDIYVQVVVFYNLGWVEYRVYLCFLFYLRKKVMRYFKVVIFCFKWVIEFEVGNFEFWNVFGVVISIVNLFVL